MGTNDINARNTDAKGRLTLGDRYKNRTVLIEERDDELVIHLARVIPERELWLYKNKKALKMVLTGIEEARAGILSDGPDLEEARKLVAHIPDDID
jgi:ABC-type nitrate/sulfonate/bicarbonate transport system substrate-binding protein